MVGKTIAVDIDDVLAANAEGLVAFSNQQWGTHLTIDDYNEHWGAMWKLEHDIEATEKRAHEFFASGSVSRLRHFSDAVPVLKELGRSYRLVLVTSRRRVLLTETNIWIERFFPGIFSEIHCAGIWDNPKEDRHTATKADLCKELGIDYLIDDQLKHCLAVAKLNITALLFGSYQWNHAQRLPKNVVRVNNWRAVKVFFDAAR